MQSYHTAGDVWGVAAQLALAKMRAAADFTDARVNFNNFAYNSTTGTYQYQLEIYNQTTGTWAIDQTGTQNTGVQNLSTNTTPAGTQTASIAQSNLIEFNSRGIPVTAALEPIKTRALAPEVVSVGTAAEPTASPAPSLRG